MRRVEDITRALWGTRVSSSTVSDLNKGIYERIEKWRNEPIKGTFCCVFLDGIWLKRNWGGEVGNVAVLVAIGVNQDGYRKILGVCEGSKEDKTSWFTFLRHLKELALERIRLCISDKCLGLIEAIYPDSSWQCCILHFYRNVFSAVSRGKVKEVALMLKAIHAQDEEGCCYTDCITTPTWRVVHKSPASSSPGLSSSFGQKMCAKYWTQPTHGSMNTIINERTKEKRVADEPRCKL